MPLATIWANFSCLGFLRGDMSILILLLLYSSEWSLLRRDARYGLVRCGWGTPRAASNRRVALPLAITSLRLIADLEQGG